MREGTRVPRCHMMVHERARLRTDLLTWPEKKRGWLSRVGEKWGLHRSHVASIYKQILKTTEP